MILLKKNLKSDKYFLSYQLIRFNQIYIVIRFNQIRPMVMSIGLTIGQIITFNQINQMIGCP